MKSYISLLKVRFINGLQYRAAALGGISTNFFWGLMAVFLYEAFYANGIQQSTFAFSDMVTYIWLRESILALTMLYDWDHELFGMITSGNISYELCRPVNLYWLWYVKLISRRLSSAILKFPPIILLAFLIPSPYRMSLPESPQSFFMFIITMFLGVILLVSISMLIYISVFKTMSPTGSMAFVGIVGEFFSGSTIPIPLMPLWLQKICYLMPFRWTTDLPLRVYSGNIGINEAIFSVGVQLFWIGILVGTGWALMNHVTHKAIIQGG